MEIANLGLATKPSAEEFHYAFNKVFYILGSDYGGGSDSDSCRIHPERVSIIVRLSVDVSVMDMVFLFEQNFNLIRNVMSLLYSNAR